MRRLQHKFGVVLTFPLLFFFGCSFCFFGTGSHCVDLADLQLYVDQVGLRFAAILLPLPLPPVLGLEACTIKPYFYFHS